MSDPFNYYILTYNASPKGESGESIGSQYDLDKACKYCGTKARLKGHLHTKGIKKVRDFFSTLDDDKIVSEHLYNKLRSADVKVKNLLKIVDRRGTLLPFYHLSSDLYFPKLSNESKGLVIEDQCLVCKQDGYFNEVIVGSLEKNITTYVAPLELFYENIEINLLEQSDIFNTWEHIGISNREAKRNKVIGYARPLLIVSKKVKKVFEENKVKNCIFTKISITPSLYQ